MALSNLPASMQIMRSKLIFGHYSIIQVNVQRYDFVRVSAIWVGHDQIGKNYASSNPVDTSMLEY